MIERVAGAAAIVAALFLAAPQGAHADGCLKGGAVGGLAGHEVGSGHAVAGAAAGCAIGHHEASKKAKERSANGDTSRDNGGGDRTQGSGSSQPPSDRQKQ